MTLRLFGFKSECIRLDFRLFGGTFAYSADFAYSAKSMVMHRFVAPWMKFGKKMLQMVVSGGGGRNCDDNSTLQRSIVLGPRR